MNTRKFVAVLTVSCAGLAFTSQAQAYAYDSFFDIDIECRGRAFHGPPTTIPDGTGATIDVEIVALSLVSAQPVLLPELSDPAFRVDSFFDVEYQLGPPGGQFQVDSFFDVFTELTIYPSSIPGAAGGGGTWSTEMVALSLTSSANPGVVYNVHGLGELAVTDLGGGQFQVDSFFDVFTEVSLDGGRTFSPGADSINIPMNTEFVTGIPIIPAPAALPAGLTVLGLGLAKRRRR